MADDIVLILDKCLERIRRGATVEECLADYPERRAELEPLLTTYRQVAAVRRASPSAGFKQDSYTRVMARLRTEPARPRGFSFSGLRRSLAFKALVPVTLVAIIALLVWGVLPVFSPLKGSDQDFTLSILSGTAEIKEDAAAAWTTAADGLVLRAGYQIRTPDDSYALLTFFDGSTITLEPGAEVMVSRSAYVDQNSTEIILEQQAGRTWSYVTGNGNTDTAFTLQTPQAEAIGQKTAFSTYVESSGTTRFAVAEGQIQVVEGDQTIQVETDKQIEIGDQIALSTPLPVPPSDNELVISTALPGVGSVRDPNGASTGHFPDGLAFNQITNSRSVLSSSAQQIHIDEPVSGEYLVAVRRAIDTDIPINIQAWSDGKIIFQHREILPVTDENGWIIRVSLDTAHFDAVSADVMAVEPLSGQNPENVIEPDLARTRLTPITAGDQTPDTTVAAAPVTPGAASTGTTSATTTAAAPAQPGPEASPLQTAASPSAAPAGDYPRVIDTWPADSASAVATDRAISAVFSLDMEASTLNESTFTLWNGVNPVSAVVSYDQTTRTAVLDPLDDLENGADYVAVISSQAVSREGIALADNYAWSFSTGRIELPEDTRRPGIVMVSPGDSAVDLASDLVIQVVFDEALNPIYILDPDSFTLSDGESVIECSAAYSKTSQSAVFTPQAALHYNTVYTATLSKTVRDLAGNQLLRDYSWSFSTAAEEPAAVLSCALPETVREGDTLDVGIYISDVTDLAAFEFDLTFDESVLQLLENDLAVTPGSLAGQALEFDSWTWSLIPGEEGRLRILGAVRGTGFNGTVELVQVHFKVTGLAGQTGPLTLSKVMRASGVHYFVYDSSGRMIPTAVNSAFIRITP